jgi:hypothetical protein
MDDATNRSTDKYYREKPKPLFRQTKEGRVRRESSFVYQQVQNDVNASNDKYYKSPSPTAVPVEALAKLARSKLVDIDDASQAVTEIASAFFDSYDAVVLNVYAEQLAGVKVAVDLAVGRSLLTREQADSVSFATRSAPVAAVLPQAEVGNAPRVEVVPDAFAKGGKRRRGRKASEAVVEDNAGEAAGLEASLDATPETSQDEPQVDEPQTEATQAEVNADDSDE